MVDENAQEPAYADGVEADAKAWIDALSAGNGVAGAWRLEVTETRSRLRRAGDAGEDDPPFKVLPVRIRRFAKGIPRGIVDAAIRYLIRSAPYRDIIYNGEKLAGEYYPTRTFWRRDDQEQVGQRSPGSYTLVQDLIEKTVEGDSYSVGSSSSCSEEVTSDWHWDEFSIGEADDLGQGVTVAVQAVSRNEDGTFNYAVVRRVAKTQCSGWKVTKCDEFETVSRCVWKGVYGTPEDPEPDPSFSGTWTVPPANACDRAAGTLVEIQWEQEDDCTWRATAVKTESGVYATSEKRESATLYSKDVSTTTRTVADAPASLPAVPPPPSDGTVTEIRRELQPDGRSVETVSTKTEQAVEGARRSVRKTLRGVVRVTLDRSLGSAELPRADALGVGDAVEVTRTDADRYDVERTEADVESVGQTGASASQTAFTSEAELRENVTLAEASGKLGVDVTSAPAGTAVSRVRVRDGVVRRTEANVTDVGSVDVSERATEYKTVRDAVVQVRKTLRGTVRSVRDRSLPSAPAVDASALPIGGSVEVSVNEAERYDVETVTPDEQPAGTLGATGTQTAFQVVAEKRENVSAQAASSLLDVNVSGAPSGTVVTRTGVSGGVVRRIEASVTEAGSVDVVERADEHVPVRQATTRRSKTLTASVTETTHRNQSAPDDGPVDVGEFVENTLNEAGLYDVTRRARDANVTIQQSAETTASPFLRTASTRFSYPAEPGTGVWGRRAGDLVGSVAYVDRPGRRVRTSVERDQDGAYVLAETVEEEQEGGITSSIMITQPYAKALHVTFGRVRPDQLQALLEGSDFGATLRSWADRVAGTGGALGTKPTKLFVDVSANEDPYGLFSGSARATLGWPDGSAGSEGQFGDEIYFDLQVAETRMAAGRGQAALERFFDSSSWQALAPAINEYVNTVQSIVDAYAAMFNLAAGSVPMGLPQFPTYTIERAQASLSYESGQWTASYVDVNVDKLYGIVLNMLPRAINTLLAIVNLNDWMATMSGSGGSS